MKTIYTALVMTRRHLFYIINSPRAWAAAILILSSVYSLIVPYAKAAWALDQNVSIGILAYNFCYGTMTIKLYLALLLVFSELPFKDPQQLMIVTRSGKRAWFLSQLFYVIAVTAAITVAVSLVSMAILIGHLSFDGSWGRMLPNAMSMYKYKIACAIPSDVLNEISPYDAIGWSLPVGTLSMISFGSVILSLNSLFRGSAGTVAGGLIIALTLIGRFIGVPGMFYLMILDWGNFSDLNIHNAPKMPSPLFEIGVLAAMLIVSISVIIFCSRKKAEIKLDEVI